MPCFTQYTWAEKVRVENQEWFRDALNAQPNLRVQESGSVIYFRGVIKEGKHDWSVDGYFDKTTGELTVQNDDQANVIRRLYAKTVVSKAAKRFGWIEQSQNDGSTLLKRRA